MESVGVDDLQWAAGFMDGDGSIMMTQLGQIVVVAGVAEPTWGALDRLESLFGGTVRVDNTSAPEINPKRKYMIARWQLKSGPAARFCAIIAPHSHLKRPQFELGATWKGVNTSSPQLAITVMRDGEEPFTGDRHEVCQELGVKMGTLERLRRDPPYGWSFTIIKRPGVNKEARMEMKREMAAMKKVPHAAIEGPLPLPYVAGFLEADGCFSLKRDQLMVSIAQKHRAIADAFQRQYGGYLGHCTGLRKATNTRRDEYQWFARGDTGAEMMKAVLPYLHTVKKRRVELMLSRNGVNKNVVDQQLADLKNMRRFL